MQFDEFMTQTQRLCDLYGKNLNETQADFWYMTLRPFDVTTYKKAVGNYARSNKYMPTISDLLAEIKKIKEHEQTGEPEEAVPRVPCEKCRGSGLVKYTKDDGYDYLCTCNCKNGKRLNLPGLKKFDDIFPHVENHMDYGTASFYTAKEPPKEDPTIKAWLDYDTSQINF